MFLMIPGDETCEDSENSSNDEDIDPTVDMNKKKRISKGSLQQNSLSTIFTKIPLAGRLSKTNSVDTNNSANGAEEIPPYRPSKKRRIWRKAFAQRRKTFTGFIKEGEEVATLPRSRPRPKSMLLPERHTENTAYMKLARTISFNGTVGVDDSECNTQNTPNASRKNTFSSSSVTTVIEHRPDSVNTEQFGTRLSIRRCPPKQLPPDIVIDIERPIPEEERFSMRSMQEIDRPPHGGSSPRPESRISTSKMNGSLQILQHPHHQHHHHHRKKKKKDAKARDTWSKYLDVHAKRHEVYCALNSVKKRLRGSGRGVRGALKKSESVHLQRKASTLILDEKRDSMK